MNHTHSTDRRAALPSQTAMRLTREDLISLELQPGDSVRSDCGTLWITVDGEPQDVLLEPGETHTVSAAGRINVSALRSACLVVLGRAPLRWQRVGELGRGFGQRLVAALALAIHGAGLVRARS